MFGCHESAVQILKIQLLAFGRCCANHSHIFVFHILLLPNWLQKLLKQVSLTQFAFFIKSCVQSHSPLKLEQSSCSPGKYLPSLISSSNSLPKCYFFLIIVFFLHCVLLISSSWNVKWTNRGAKENKCPSPELLNPPYWSFWERKLQGRKQQQIHCICGNWQSILLKSQFSIDFSY